MSIQCRLERSCQESSQEHKQMSNKTGKQHACMSNPTYTSMPCAIPTLNKLYVGDKSSFEKQVHIKAHGHIVETSNSTDNSGPCTCLIRLPIAMNRENCHFKFPKLELRCKRLKRGQVRILSFSKWSHRPYQLYHLLNLERCLYFDIHP